MCSVCGFNLEEQLKCGSPTILCRPVTLISTKHQTNRKCLATTAHGAPSKYISATEHNTDRRPEYPSENFLTPAKSNLFSDSPSYLNNSKHITCNQDLNCLTEVVFSPSNIFWKKATCGWNVTGSHSNDIEDNLKFITKIAVSGGRCAGINGNGKVVVLSGKALSMQEEDQSQDVCRSGCSCSTDLQITEDSLEGKKCKLQKTSHKSNIMLSEHGKHEKSISITSKFSDIKLLDDDRMILLAEDGSVMYENNQATHLVSWQPPTPVMQVCVGRLHSLMLTADGAVYCWGDGMRGQLGVEGIRSSDHPQLVPLLHGVTITKIAAGGWHSIAVGECGEAYVWGWNSDGQLGLPSKTPSGTIETLKHFCSCRISNDAEGNSSAQSASVDKCADSLDTISSTQESVNVQSTPEMVQVFGDSNVVEVAAGDRHSLFLMDDGTVWSCGWNKYGQCGVCCHQVRVCPSPVPGVSGVRRVWAGGWCSVFQS